MNTEPIDVVLPCPRCGMLHIDAPEVTNNPGRMSAAALESGAVEEVVWTNPPHKSHLCHGCGCVWRPADVPTNGVAAVKTRGEKDGPGDTDEPPTPEWLAAVGAQQLDPHHPNEWSVIVPRDNSFGTSFRLTVCLDGTGPGVTWDEIEANGYVSECVTLVFADLTRGRFRDLCRAVGAPLREAR